MKRYQHFVRPTTGDSYPSQIVIVDIDTEYIDVKGRPGTRIEQLCSWTAVLQRYTAGNMTFSDKITGYNPATFWCRIDKLLGKGKSVWLIADNCIRTMTLLGLWEDIEHGKTKVAGTDNRNPHTTQSSLPELREQGSGDSCGERERMVRKMPAMPLSQDGEDDCDTTLGVGNDRIHGGGCAVLEDPPTIIIATRPHVGGVLKILDIRNYAYEHPCKAAQASVRVSNQSGFIRSVIDMLREGEYGSLRCTAGSQSVYSWRRKLPKGGIYVHNFSSALSLERDSYHGGRCEAYAIGDIRGRVYHLDIRNLYCWCCVNHAMPCVIEEINNGEHEQGISSLSNTEMQIADVDIETDSADYPCVVSLSENGKPYPVSLQNIPFRGISRGQVIYPIGRFRTTLAGPELRDAMLYGRVTRVHRVATYSGFDCLSSYLASWYERLEDARSSGDKPLQGYIKRVIVSIAGKLGETGKGWVPAAPEPQYGPWNSWRVLAKDGKDTRYRNVAGLTQREVISAESAESMPAMASWITSLGRVRMLHLIRIAGKRNVYYMDTDSLMVNEDGYGSLLASGSITEGVLGTFRVIDVCESTSIRGVKHYRHSGQWRCSGVSGVGSGRSTNTDGMWQGSGVGGAVKGQHAPDSIDRLISVNRYPAYAHGRVQEDGSVLPWILGE